MTARREPEPTRRLAVLAAVLLAVLGPGATATAAGHRRSSPAPLLGLDQARFWEGPTVRSGDVRDPSLCGTAAGACSTWPLDLPGGGERLRVAIDTPMRSNTFELDLVDPQGKVAARATNSNMFDAEAFVPKPAAGRWTVRVMPQGVHNAAFRLRAKLESRVPAPPRGRVAMLPNLKAVPPMEFTFIAPANPANGLYPPDAVNPPLDVLGGHPLTCTATRTLANTAWYWLRMRASPGSVHGRGWAGPVHVITDPASDPPSGSRLSPCPGGFDCRDLDL